MNIIIRMGITLKMKVGEAIKEITHRYLKCMQKEYEKDSDKVWNCVAFHLYQTALKESVTTPNLSTLIDAIIDNFIDPYQCPENLADTSSCGYSRFLVTYAKKIIDETKKRLNNGNK